MPQERLGERPVGNEGVLQRSCLCRLPEKIKTTCCRGPLDKPGQGSHNNHEELAILLLDFFRCTVASNA